MAAAAKSKAGNVMSQGDSTGVSTPLDRVFMAEVNAAQDGKAITS